MVQKPDNFETDFFETLIKEIAGLFRAEQEMENKRDEWFQTQFHPIDESDPMVQAT